MLNGPHSDQFAEALRPDVIHRRIRQLSGLGPRYVGTAGEREARQLLVQQLREAGVPDVREEPLTVVQYEEVSATCVYNGALPATGLQFTASGAVQAPAVYLGCPANAAEIEELQGRGVELQGRIAILHSIYPYELLPHITASGAVGVVVACSTPSGLISRFTGRMYPRIRPEDFDESELDVPGVIVNEEALRPVLVDLALGPAQVAIEHVARYAPVETANVVAEVPGTESSERVVVGAHYDTQYDTPGACDNATGLAALVAIAEGAVRSAPKRTLVLVAFADEEHGLAGSTEYCLAHREELNSTIAMINLDALGWALAGERALYADPAIRDIAFEAAAAIGWTPEHELEASTFAGSDYNPFIDAGVPAAYYWRYPPPHPYYHTSGDVPELVDAEMVSETAMVAAHLAMTLANDLSIHPGRSKPTVRYLELRPEHLDAAAPAKESS
jgi:hypothetical protein